MLAGGAARGAFQAGVVKELARSGLRFDKIVGTSVGAVNGAALLHGYGPELPDMWRENLREVAWFDARRMFRFRSPFLISEAMRIMVDRYGDIEQVVAHPTELLISTTEWGTRRNVLFSTKDKESGWTEEERVLHLLASLTIPFVCTEKIVIRGQRYCDGALSENMPLAPLLEAGCTRIVIVDPSPTQVRSLGGRFLRATASPLLKTPLTSLRVLGGMAHAVTADGPSVQELSHIDLIWVTPPDDLPMRSLDFRSLEAIEAALEAGLAAGSDLVERLQGSPAPAR
jgi:predicted acylesterase/phospholipase RssA